MVELGLREGGRVEAARGALTLPNNGGGPKCAGEGIARSTSLAAFGNNRTSRLNNHSQNLPASKDPFSVLPTSRQSLAADTPPRQTENTQLPRSTSMGTLTQPSCNLPVPDPIPPLLSQNTFGSTASLPRKPTSEPQDSCGLLRSSSVANVPFSSTQSLFSLRSQSKSPEIGRAHV